MQSTIKALTEQHKEYVVNTYHHLHAHPELSFEESVTAAFIIDELKAMNIPFRSNIGGNGILGKLEGKNPTKKVIALRADMDALPICEAVDIPWKSTKENVMHACGHDSHVACLLGTAKVLHSLRETWEGTILLIFQPAEEKAPGGARMMLEQGVFDEIEPELIIAQHVSVDYPTGTMGFLSGMVMASSDEVHLKIKGKGGHGALPHLCNDTILCAAQTLVSLQQVRSRLCHPLTPMVLTFGKIVGGSAQNVIPHEVTLAGTLRTVDEAWRKKAKEHIVRIVEETADAYGCTTEITIPEGYPCVINDENITNQARKFAEEWVGKDKVVNLEMRMTSEDFSFFTQKYPCTFYRYGALGEKNKDTGGLHSANFRIDEEALITGTGGLSWLAYRFMTNE